jgi:hypothetical protein
VRPGAGPRARATYRSRAQQLQFGFSSSSRILWWRPFHDHAQIGTVLDKRRFRANIYLYGSRVYRRVRGGLSSCEPLIKPTTTRPECMAPSWSREHGQIVLKIAAGQQCASSMASRCDLERFRYGLDCAHGLPPRTADQTRPSLRARSAATIADPRPLLYPANALLARTRVPGPTRPNAKC